MTTTAHNRTHSAADRPAGAAPGAGTGQPPPERKPLLVRWGKKIGTTFVDGIKVCKPGDADYEDEYTYAVFALENYGHPMPYARSEAERGAAAAGKGKGAT